MENSFYTLLAVLFPLCILVFILTEYDILNPACIVASLMTFSVFLASTKIERWHLYMSADASLLIITSLCCFIFSGLWVDWRIKKNIGGIPALKEDCIYSISNTGILAMSCIILILGYFQHREFYDSSVMLGNTSGPLDFSSMIKTIRPSIERETFRFSRWYYYRTYLAQALFYCNLFVFFMRSIRRNFRFQFRKNIKYLTPFIPFMTFFVCATGRTLPLYLILFGLITGAIIYQIQNGFFIQCKINIIAVCLLCGFIFFVSFLILGTLSGKVSPGGRSPYEVLVHYVGLSMPAFSLFLEQIPMETPYIGNTTLNGIYNNLNRLGDGLSTVKVFLPFVRFSDIDTNVYTMMARYINDYGFVGMHLIMAIISIFYTILYDYIRFISLKFDCIPYYGFLPITLFFATNDDCFLSQILSTETFYKCVLFYLIYKIFVKKTIMEQLSH